MKSEPEICGPYEFVGGEQPFDPRNGFALEIRVHGTASLVLEGPEGQHISIKKIGANPETSRRAISLTTPENQRVDQNSAMSLARLLSAFTGCSFRVDPDHDGEYEFRCIFSPCDKRQES